MSGFAVKEKKKEKRTAIPTQLKERVERSIGLSLDDERANYNSDLPAKREEPLESKIIQRARGDEKKEKWKKGRGRLDWKHGRKKGFDKKHSIFEEDIEEETAMRPIVSDILRRTGFDETHYLAPSAMLYSLYADLHDADLLEYINSCSEQLNPYDVDGCGEFFDEHGKDIFDSNPQIKERATKMGNCGTLANFLYEDKADSTRGDFDAFIQELEQEVSVDKVKLIRAQANIGHAFTLICYRQNDKTVIELIQAWQDQYSVKKSLDNAAKQFYINSELVNKFRVMHEDIQNKEGNQYFNEVFLGAPLKSGIDNFEITHLDTKILKEPPEQYAERIAAKEQ